MDEDALKTFAVGGIAVALKFLGHNQTLNVNLYSEQLQHVNKNLRKKHPAFVNRKTAVFFHKIARPHAAKVTQKNVLQLS